MYEYTFHLYLQITTPWSDAIMMNTILQIKKKKEKLKQTEWVTFPGLYWKLVPESEPEPKNKDLCSY